MATEYPQASFYAFKMAHNLLGPAAQEATKPLKMVYDETCKDLETFVEALLE